MKNTHDPARRSGKVKAQRREARSDDRAPQDRKPVRLAPTDDPAETVERMISRRQLIVEEGDVIISRESAGLRRQSPDLSGLTTSNSQYRLSIRGLRDDRGRVFAMYERAVVDGEAFAAEKRVRLFYVEDAALTLLKDYRPPPGGPKRPPYHP